MIERCIKCKEIVGMSTTELFMLDVDAKDIKSISKAYKAEKRLDTCDDCYD
jgi:hypothetical protein